MISHKTKKLPKNTLELIVSVPWTVIEKEYNDSVDKLVKEIEVEGFRKGKAPRSVAEKQLKKEKVYDDLLQRVLNREYERIIKEDKIEPIASPKIDLKQAKENEDWEIVFTIALKPDIDVKKYKDIVKKAKKDASGADIWVPGKDESQKPDEKAKKEKVLSAVIDALMEKISIEISDVIVDDEVDKRMSKLVDDVQRLGMSMDTYLKSRQTDSDKMKEQFRKEIEETYRMEFLLQEIGDEEKITVEKEDIDKMVTNLKTEEEKQALMKNIYYYASVLRKQKVLEHIMSIN